MATRGGKRPGAGRPKGSRNRRSLDVQERLEALNCDPIEGLARIASQAEKDGETSLALDVYRSLLPYVAPKLRASTLSVSSENSTDIADMLRDARNAVVKLRSGLAAAPDPEPSQKPC